MRMLLCNKCLKYIKEIEFEYIYFHREYSKICKECEKNKPSEINKDKK